MADYPDLIPSSRRYSLGDVPAAASEWLGALEVSHRFGDATTGHRLSLAYDDATTDAEWLTIRNHWAGQEGGTLPFAVPAQVWCGHTGYGDVVGGLQWRYASPPQRSDRDGRLGAGTVELVAERISQPLLSDDAAPWFGTAVPLVAEGSDPGPPPPVVPTGTPEYVVIDGPPEVIERAGGDRPASSGTGAAGGEVGGEGFDAVVGNIISLPIGNEPEVYTPPASNIVSQLNRDPRPGDPLDYTPQCTNPGTARWFFVPDVDDANEKTAGKTAPEVREMLSGEYGVTAASGLSLAALRELYAKAAELADYGVVPLKNDTVAKLNTRIDELKSKGKKRGARIPINETTSTPVSAPVIYGGGRIYIEDNCGAGYGNWQQTYPIGSSAWKGRTSQRVMVLFGKNTAANSNDYDVWGDLSGITPASSNGFFIDNGLLWTYTDDGEPYLVGGGSQGGGTGASRYPAGFLVGYRVIESEDEAGNRSGTYSLVDGEWFYNPPSP
jgi:hypothetical protein